MATQLYASLLITLMLSSTQVFAWPKKFIIKLKPLAQNTPAKILQARLAIPALMEIEQLNLKVVSFRSAKRLKDFVELLSSQIEYIEEDLPMKAIVTPDDPRYSEQENMARLQLEEAWEHTTGSKDIIVAVSDTGVSLDHPDLKDHIWSNPGEIAGNGIDDDRNGFVDDVHGWNFAVGNNNPDDKHGHGTHVAGIIGAVGDNGEGISGVNWNVTIMPVQFLDKNGSGSTSGGVATIVYAADNGAKVLNASWGGPGSSKSLGDAVTYAYRKGMLVVAAAGNSSANNDTTTFSPAGIASPNLLAIASSDSNGRLSSFSNFGHTSVHMVAPGRLILSSLPGDKYGRFSGTSMAAPMASGVAALILSVESALSVVQLKNALINANNPTGSYAGKIANSGDLSALLAITQMQKGAVLWPSQVAISGDHPFQFSTYGTQKRVRWSLDSTRLATIDRSGVLKPKGDAEGPISVVATDENGQEIGRAHVMLVKGSGSRFGGCLEDAKAQTTAQEIERGFRISGTYIALYLMLLWYRRRRRHLMALRT